MIRLIAAAILLLPYVLRAQFTIQLGIAGVQENHEISWNTRTGHFYQLQVSPDLTNWSDSGINEEGTGEDVTYGFSAVGARTFYRIREFSDPQTGSFLTRPYQNQEFYITDGVCFGFNLMALSELPAKICLFQRPYGSNTWNQIGAITDLSTLKGIRCVQGSAVWVATAEGTYEVKAEAKNAGGAILALASRTITIGHNTPPTVSLTKFNGGEFPQYYTTMQPADNIETLVFDADGDAIVRVDYFDNGVLFATDRDPDPDFGAYGGFGSTLYLDQWPTNTHIFAKGSHIITAVAYDEHGGTSQPSVNKTIEITGGDTKTILTVQTPVNNDIITRGQNLEISYTVSDADGIQQVTRINAEVEGPNGGYESSTSVPSGTIIFNTSLWGEGERLLRIYAEGTAGGITRFSNITLRKVRIIAPPEENSFASLCADELEGPGVTVSNPIFRGIKDACSLFGSTELPATLSGLQIDTGVVLTTGLAQAWNGGDLSEETETWLVTTGDIDLELRGSRTRSYDPAILEFDTICDNGQLELELQFGSEEYLEFIGDSDEKCFNDLIFISVDGIPISITPDCSASLGAGYIHPFILSNDCLPPGKSLAALNEHYYVDDTEIDLLVAPEYQNQQCEYDGMSVRLRLHAFITPQITHHVRIVIADVNDERLDSAVFIRKSSLISTAPSP